MLRDLANEPTVQAALQLNQVQRPRIRFVDRLLLVAALPAGCYLLLKALLFGGDVTSDASMALAEGLVKGLECMGGFVCFFVSLRAYFKIRRARRGIAA